MASSSSSSAAIECPKSAIRVLPRSSARAMDGIAFGFDLARKRGVHKYDFLPSKTEKDSHSSRDFATTDGGMMRRHPKSEIMREKCLGKSCECPSWFADSAKRPPRFSFIWREAEINVRRTSVSGTSLSKSGIIFIPLATPASQSMDVASAFCSFCQCNEDSG